MDGVKSKKKYIAILVQNFVQFYAVKPFVDAYKNAIIHLYVPQCRAGEEVYAKMYDDIYNFLRQNYKNVYRDAKSYNYDILMEPYPIAYFDSLKCQKRIKYKYSANSAKPEPVYRPEHNYNYDLILCHNSYEQEVLAAYAPTALVEKLNYVGFEKNVMQQAKKRILYAPTFGDLCSANDKLLQAFKDTSAVYEIIVKVHHATSGWQDEMGRQQTINHFFDKCYDEATPLSELLAQVDAVVTDNSGTIFEAMYAGVPVATFAEMRSGRDYNGVQPLQDILRQEGIIPYTNQVTKLAGLLDQVLSKETRVKQKKYSDALFPLQNRYGMQNFIKVIDDLLKEPPLARRNRGILKRAMATYITALKRENEQLRAENYTLQINNAELKAVAEARVSTKVMNKIRYLMKRKVNK